MLKIKKGDEVIVLTGRDKGKQGTVSALAPNGKCFVNGIKMVKNFEQLKQGLTISDVPPPPGIVYQATIKGKNVTIPIAKMTNRPDGVGYGENWKLEFSY